MDGVVDRRKAYNIRYMRRRRNGAVSIRSCKKINLQFAVIPTTLILPLCTVVDLLYTVNEHGIVLVPVFYAYIWTYSECASLYSFISKCRLKYYWLLPLHHGWISLLNMLYIKSLPRYPFGIWNHDGKPAMTPDVFWSLQISGASLRKHSHGFIVALSNSVFELLLFIYLFDDFYWIWKSSFLMLSLI